MLYVNSEIKDLLCELDICVGYDPNLDDPGRYIEQFNFIALRSGLSEEQEFKALVHELGHACDHHNCLDRYERLFSGGQMERVANNFLISEALEQYMSINCLEPSQVNYTRFLDDMELDYSYTVEVKKLLGAKMKLNNQVK